MSERTITRLPQAVLIADRMVLMFAERWPAVHDSLTSECLASMRAIVANDVDCLLRALGGDRTAQETFFELERTHAEALAKFKKERKYRGRLR